MNDKKKTDIPAVPQITINPDTTPILYADNIFMNVNPDGVVLEVRQRVATSGQIHIVSRIGMSREHAKKFVNELGKLLVKADGKVQTGKKILN